MQRVSQIYPDLLPGEDVPDRWVTGDDGEPFELPIPIARLRNTYRAREARIRETYDVPEGVCVFCENTGKQVHRDDPEDMNQQTGVPCLCQIGEQTGLRQKREEHWNKVIPPRYQPFTLDTCPNHALIGTMYDWLGPDPHKTGHGLVICGHVGRGKTGAAIGALRHYHDQGISVDYRNVQELLDDIKADFDKPMNRPDHEQALTKAGRARLLLLDDLGAERVTDWSMSVIDQLLRKRYENYKATVMTSNLTRDAFERYAGGRLMSRINDSATVIWAEGPDYRDRRVA